jgi:hypothetical protein
MGPDQELQPVVEEGERLVGILSEANNRQDEEAGGRS